MSQLHASPSMVGKYVEHWPAELGDVPAREGGGRDSGRLYDADMVLATLRHLVMQGHSVLAAGDYNECLKWDADHDEKWGELYFGAVTAAGLTSVLHDRFRGERRTSYAAGAPAYQLDHVLATDDVAVLVRDPSIPQWDETRVAAGECSDHAPVYFTLAHPG